MEARHLLTLATEAAEEAGSRLAHDVDRTAVETEYGRDIKHSGDRLAEKIILDRLRAGSDFPILSEERGADACIDAGPFWVVDPLDGTMNYSRGLPLACVSIGLFQNNQPMLGVVYDFGNDELFTGIVGEGAWCNDDPVRVSSVRDPERAILATGFPVGRSYKEKDLARFIARVQGYKKVRMLGSAALSLAYIAGGRLDIYCEEDIMLWDVAAGAALVAAAGGAIQLAP